MEATKSRQIIYSNMDALSLEMDARDNLIEIRKGIKGYIDKINKSIERGQGYNRQLESLTKHAA